MRFEKVVFRSKKFTDKVNLQAEELKRSIREIRHAWREGDRQKARQFGSLLKSEVKTFKKMVAQFRGAQSRVRVMGRFSHRVETFLERNEDRFTKDAVTGIQADFVIIDQKRMELKELYQKTIKNIRATFGELKALKKQRESMKKRRGAKP